MKKSQNHPSKNQPKRNPKSSRLQAGPQQLSSPQVKGDALKVVISSGHALYVRGASGVLDEVNEAREVVESVAKILKDAGVNVVTFHDDVSMSQNENLNRIVNFHNAQGAHELDVSVHFNAYQSTSKPMGHECLFLTQQTLAAEESQAVSQASGLINRGAKKRTDLFFLSNCKAPAILIEVCFVDSRADADIYHNRYDSICLAIAEVIADRKIEAVPPPPAEPGPRPTLSKGDFGPDVVYLQEQLNVDNNAMLTVDGDFGQATESAVIVYQATRQLVADGIVGPQTWEALDNDAPPYVPLGLPSRLNDVHQANIAQIAMNAKIADYNWNDRGVAPPAYIQGFAVCFANVYRKLLVEHPAVMEMAQKRTTNSKDVFNVYKEFFDDLGMSNESDGEDTLRHLYALLLGLGMRESSGQHCCGRDQSADNTDSETCEAGLYQTSYNAHNASTAFDRTMDEYLVGKPQDNPQGFLPVFSQGITCSSANWQSYGSGPGFVFQEMCKKMPAFAVETAAITLRNLCNHYGPINRLEAELRPEADDMLAAVQDYVDSIPMV